jgi:hypothetical protein
MRINIVIIGFIVWVIALSIPARTLHAQSTSAWQTLPYQKQITEACFDTQHRSSCGNKMAMPTIFAPIRYSPTIRLVVILQ